MRYFLSAVLILACTLWSFDGKRDGFLFGVSIGLPWVSFTQTITPPTGPVISSDRQSKIGGATEIKLGAGFWDKNEIYYFSKIAFFTMENAYKENVFALNGLLGLGYSRCVWQSQSPTLYSDGYWSPSLILSGGVGVSTWNAPYAQANYYNTDQPSLLRMVFMGGLSTGTWLGTGAYGSVAYEMTKHAALSLDFMYSKTGTTDFISDLQTNSIVTLFSLRLLAF
jgi:hypothetical protein